MIGAVTTMVVAGMLVVRFLDRPYENASGSIKPVSMMMTLSQIEAQNPASQSVAAEFCDEDGGPRGG
jgi:hypothetical protein